MRRHTAIALFLALVVLAFSGSPAQGGSLQAHWVPLASEQAGQTHRIQVTRLDERRVEVLLRLDGFWQRPTAAPVPSGLSGPFHRIWLDRSGTTRSPGEPALPVLLQRLARGSGTEPVILDVILDVQVNSRRISGLLPEPFQPKPKRCGSAVHQEFFCNTTSYTREPAQHEPWAQLQPGGVIRAVPVSELLIRPFRFHPATSEVEVASTMKITIELRELDPAQLPPRAWSPTFLRMLNGQLANPILMDGVGDNQPQEALLVIAADALLPAVDEWAQWKEQRGLAVEVMPLSQVGSDHVAVAAAIQQAYQEQHGSLVYVLLVGDGEGENVVPFVPSPLGCASDFLYTTLEGDDLYSDVLIGRISAHTLAEAQLQFDKALWYERDPLAGQGSNWLERSLCISSSEGEGGSNDDYRSDIICDLQSEHGYDALKLYRSVGNDTAGNITGAVNGGLGWVTYLGHGSGTSWGTTVPPYETSHIAQLQNIEMLPFIMDVSCSNGAFDSEFGDCLAEAWLKSGSLQKLTAGVGCYSASTPAAWDEPAEMAIGLTRALLEDQTLPWAAACASARAYMMEVMPLGGALEEVSHQYVVFGDPSLMLRTTKAETLTVEVPAALDVGTLQLDVAVLRGGLPAPGASVTLHQDGGYLIYAKTGSDGVATVELPPLSPGLLVVSAYAGNSLPVQKVVVVVNPGCGALLVQPLANCESQVEVSLFDTDMNLSNEVIDTVTVAVESAGAQAEERQLLETAPDSGLFAGVVSFSSTPGPGVVVVSHASPVGFRYQDAGCDAGGGELQASVDVDCIPPAISGVEVVDLSSKKARIIWTTDEPSVGRVRVGEMLPPGYDFLSMGISTSHSAVATGLAQLTTYYFEILATDMAGNTSVENAGGAYLSFSTPACAPACDEKNCGDDGCGGSCGSCCSDQSCVDGTCMGGPGCVATEGMGCNGCSCEACVCAMDPYCCDTAWDGQCVSECVDSCGGCPPVGDCTGKECGDDGCGGFCGECGAGLVCTPAFQCAEPCTPVCQHPDGTPFQCGSDGCWGSCGECPAGQTCTELHTCHDPCGGITYEGCCEGTMNLYCDSGTIISGDCAVNGQTCGWNGESGWYDCQSAPGEDPTGNFPRVCPGPCEPACSTAECGPDGCGGLCGVCEAGSHCKHGKCQVPCLPDCDQRECGSDGCGGRCGECDGDATCTPEGHCFPDETPDVTQGDVAEEALWEVVHEDSKVGPELLADHDAQAGEPDTAADSTSNSDGQGEDTTSGGDPAKGRSGSCAAAPTDQTSAFPVFLLLFSLGALLRVRPRAVLRRLRG